MHGLDSAIFMVAMKNDIETLIDIKVFVAIEKEP